MKSIIKNIKHFSSEISVGIQPSMLVRVHPPVVERLDFSFFYPGLGQESGATMAPGDSIGDHTETSVLSIK